MKSLILGDCDHLIKFILFGEEGNVDNKNISSKEEREKRHIIRHIPRNKLRPGKTLIKDDDLSFNMKDDKNKPQDNEEVELENNMELAIYHCKGNFNLLTL
jgi:hypothetical protein